MSLNGLDNATVKEAHEAAVAEAGGWLLLKYISRDEVEVLDRGSGGAAEMRTRMEEYEEPSPLFGFLRYRRRNVLLKYQPEGCSRLIQARSTVHFNAVCDRFAPSEITLEITEPKELNDARLSNASSLHTASTSTSSSNSSLRRRRLMEIAEEEEDEQREAKRQSTVEEEVSPGEIDGTQPRPRSPITGPPVTLDSNLATSPKATQFADTEEPPPFVGAAPRPASPAKSFEADTLGRTSSQSSRQDYYSHSSHLYGKPRVKLGPRPSNDPAGRPRSSGSSSRPVASMPVGFKFSTKGAKKGHGKTQDDASSVISEGPPDTTFLAPALSIPEDTARPHTSGGRPSTSSGVSVKSLSAITPATKQNTLTPEKIRLMKALQLREKKKKEREQPAAAMVPSVEVTASSDQHLGQDPAASAKDSEVPASMQILTDNEKDLAADQVSKADSGIEIASTVQTDHASLRTQTDSRPASPACASSEVGDSTQASSISESTDETAHAQEQEPENEVNDGKHSSAQQPDDEPATGNSVTEEVKNVSTEGQDPSQASLTRTEEPSDVQGAETNNERDTSSDLDKELINSESSLAPVPTSKFAANLSSGQAVVENMESRDQDPHNVTSGPGRIDEVDPTPVDPSERTEDGSASTSPKLNVPISKYSTHDSSKSLASSSIPVVAKTSNDSPDGNNIIADAADTMDAESASGEKKRSGRPAPIRTDLDLPQKSTFKEDQREPEETKNPTVDDAKPIVVASPVTAGPPQPNETPTPSIKRTVSSPVPSPRSTAGDMPPPSARSISSGGMAFQQRMSQQSANHLAAARQPTRVGGGIASRIKAFEQIAVKNAPPPPPVVTGSKERPSSAFFSIRKNSVRDGARSPSVLERTSSIYRGRAGTPVQSMDGSPESVIKPSRERSGSVASRLSVFEGGSVPVGRPETIQVTARIVRDSGHEYPKAPESQVDPSEYTSLDLKQSPLIVDHRQATDPNEPPATDAPPVPTPLVHAGEPRISLHERRLSRDSKRFSIEDPRDLLHRPGQRTSLTMARDFIRDSMAEKDVATNPRPPSMQQPNNNSFMSRLSITTRRKSVYQDPALLSPISTDGGKSESGDDKPKEGNRASRLMRRLSSTFSPTRKQSTASTSPALEEERTDEVDKAIPNYPMTAPLPSHATPTISPIGDVNVQFPENLLWKRRRMSLDSMGFLHLSPPEGAISARERQLKRYHMSEFMPPYAPEIEVQELPNSVCLDFINGSGLQIAYQDRVGQLNGLQVLQNAHRRHAPSRT